MSSCNLRDDNLFKVELLNSSLIDLDLSFNKNLNSLIFLNSIFSKCNKLKRLNLSDMELTDEKIKGVLFDTISTELEEINLSNNITLN